jgi:hypothetical protein
MQPDPSTRGIILVLNAAMLLILAALIVGYIVAKA